MFALRSLILTLALCVSAARGQGGIRGTGEETFPGAKEEETRRMLQGVDRVIVAFKNTAGENAARAKATVVHLEIEGQDAIAMDIPVQAIQGLQNNPNIDYIETDEILYASTTQSIPYGIKAVEADLFYSINVPSPSDGKKVCIIDSGYDLGHLDLPSTGVTGYNKKSGTAWSTDTCGHGKCYFLIEHAMYTSVVFIFRLLTCTRLSRQVHMWLVSVSSSSLLCWHDVLFTLNFFD